MEATPEKSELGCSVGLGAGAGEKGKESQKKENAVRMPLQCNRLH